MGRTFQVCQGMTLLVEGAVDAISQESIAISRDRDIIPVMPNLGIYVPGPLHGRMQRLKGMGIEIAASAICQRCLEQAITAEERALTGDRLAKVAARLKSARTTSEQISEEAESLGRQWAEDTAFLSELRQVAVVGDYMDLNRLDVSSMRATGGRSHVVVDFLVWSDDPEEGAEPWGEPLWLAGSIPVDEIERIGLPGRINYRTLAFRSFCKGATAVLDAVEEVIRQEGGEVPPRVMPGEKAD